MVRVQIIILSIVSILIILFAGCSAKNPVVEKQLVVATSNKQLFYRTNGIRNIQLENRYGGIILNRYDLFPIQDSIRIYLNKTTKSMTAKAASLLMDSIQCHMEIIKNEISISISAPYNSEKAEYYCSFSVSLPFAMLTRISESQGPVFAEELDSTLVIEETQSDVIIDRHLGSCEIHNLKNVTAGLILPDSNFCRIFTETGNIFLNISDSASCRINMKSEAGSIDYSNIKIINLFKDSKSIQGMIGTGRSEIHLESQSGNILVKGN
jgi:hypothetical protein